MRKLLLGMFIIPAFVIGLDPSAQARAVPAMPFPQVNKLQAADLIVTGQVVSIEDQDVTVGNQKYRIAVVQVTDTLKGKMKDKMVRIGFIPPVQVGPGGVPGPGGVLPGGPAIQPLPAPGVKILPAPAVQPAPAQDLPAIAPAQPGPAIQPAPVQPGPIGKPAIQPVQPQPQPVQPIQPGPIKKFPPFQPNFNVQLKVGDDGIFYLKSQAEGKFHTLVPAYGAFVSSAQNGQYEIEVAHLKVTANPMTALKADTADKRATAAIVLIKEYRQPVFVPGKGQVQEAISAEESKLILKALLEADWPVPPQPINYEKSAAQAFAQLGLTQQDGWQNAGQPVYSQQYTDAAKAWLKKNWDTYQIKKYVGGGAAGGPVGGPIHGGPVIQPFPVPPAPGAPGGVGGAGAGQGGIAVPGIAVPGVIQGQATPVAPVPGKQLPPLPPNN